MACIEELDYEILLGNSSCRECADYIKANFNEIYYVMPGYRIFDLHLIGIPPIPVGIDAEDIVLPYLKPCRGSFVLKIQGINEIQALRIQKKEVIKFDGVNYEVAYWDGNICEKCPRKRAFIEGYRLVQNLKRPGLSSKLVNVTIKFLELLRRA